MIDPPTICICTFRRESIAATLQSIASLDSRLSPAEVLVVDNDEHAGARETIVGVATDAGVNIRYVHAPARNISIARNAALDECRTRWAALIDDDETARTDWLLRLGAHTDSAQAIIGVSCAVYAKDLPKWLSRHDFHSNRLARDTGNAYTSNALIDVEFVRQKGLRFREDLGQTGGEDTMFFRQFAQANGRIIFEPSAIVDEIVAPARANMKWVMRRSFRSGQTHGLILRELDPASYRKLFFTASAKLAACAIMAVVDGLRGGRWRSWIKRGALHAGALSYTIKPEILQEYGRAKSGA